jgi:hypothetical protein
MFQQGIANAIQNKEEEETDEELTQAVRGASWNILSYGLIFTPGRVTTGSRALFVYILCQKLRAPIIEHRAMNDKSEIMCWFLHSARMHV